VIGWVVCVVPLLTLTIGYLLLHLPQVSQALWRSASLQGRLTIAAAADRHYAIAAVGAVGAALLILSLAGSPYIVTGLVRRTATVSLHWSADRPACRLVAVAATLACAITLAAFWAMQGQFRGW
jgi:hypothetical protein